MHWESPHVDHIPEEHHNLHTGEVRPDDVTQVRCAGSARCWAVTVYHKRSVINIIILALHKRRISASRRVYMKAVALVSTHCPQISRSTSLLIRNGLRTDKHKRFPQNMCEEPNMCGFWVVENNHPNQDWRNRRWTRDNGSGDDGARKRVHSGSESRLRHQHCERAACSPQITLIKALHNKNWEVIWEEYVNIRVYTQESRADPDPSHKRRSFPKWLIGLIVLIIIFISAGSACVIWYFLGEETVTHVFSTI